MRTLLFLVLITLSLTIQAFEKDTSTAISKDTGHSIVQQQYNDLLAYYFAAARTDDTEIIKKFVNAGVPIDSYNEKGYTALMIATYHGNKGSVTALLSLGANACLEDNRGNTALMAAIFRGEFSIAKTLVSLDCDNDHQNKAGQTAEQFAQTFGQQKILALLSQVSVK